MKITCIEYWVGVKLIGKELKYSFCKHVQYTLVLSGNCEDAMFVRREEIFCKV